MSPQAPTLDLKIEFGGGLELLFGGVRSHRVALPTRVPPTPSPASCQKLVHGEEGHPANITYLIAWLRENLLKERAELFVEGASVCVSDLFSLRSHFELRLTSLLFGSGGRESWCW